MNIGERIKSLRTEKGLTQTDLATKAEMNYIQIGRYESQKTTPSTEVLQRIANALDTTADFLMNGATADLASTQLQDKELLNLFNAVEKLSDEDKNMIKTFIDAIITKRKIQKLV